MIASFWLLPCAQTFLGQLITAAKYVSGALRGRHGRSFALRAKLVTVAIMYIVAACSALGPGPMSAALGPIPDIRHSQRRLSPPTARPPINQRPQPPLAGPRAGWPACPRKPRCVPACCTLEATDIWPFLGPSLPRLWPIFGECLARLSPSVPTRERPCGAEDVLHSGAHLRVVCRNCAGNVLTPCCIGAASKLAFGGAFC